MLPVEMGPKPPPAMCTSFLCSSHAGWQRIHHPVHHCNFRRLDRNFLSHPGHKVSSAATFGSWPVVAPGPGSCASFTLLVHPFCLHLSREAPDLQPQLGSNLVAFLFWFAFICTCSFFVLNLTIGVVFYEFQRLKLLSETGSAVLTAGQMVCKLNSRDTPLVMQPWLSRHVPRPPPVPHMLYVGSHGDFAGSFST